MNQAKVLVIGSSNTDMVVRSERLPGPGETIMGGEFLMNPGGKGANQAVAAARMGGKVTFISRVGEDMFGKNAIRGFEEEGIDTQFIGADSEAPSGVALILVNSQGENSIAVAPGANGKLLSSHIDKARIALESADFLLMQLEIPLETVMYAAQVAHKMGTKVVLNPAPAQALPDSLLASLYMITPNETESQRLTGVPVTDERSAGWAAKALHDKGVEVVVITMGSQGAYVLSKAFEGMLSPPKVQALDTTAAGDTFNGALVVALGTGKSLDEAVQFANYAAAISTTRMGAQASVPSLEEVEERMKI